MAVNVTYERVTDTLDRFGLGAMSMPTVDFDFSEMTQEQRNEEHMGARVLCMAALACYTNTFANSLTRNGAEIKFMKASASSSKEKDETLRTRYTTLDLKLEVGLDEKHREVFEEVKDNMLNGSLLTYSLEDAIDVDYNIEMITD